MTAAQQTEVATQELRAFSRSNTDIKSRLINFQAMQNKTDFDYLQLPNVAQFVADKYGVTLQSIKTKSRERIYSLPRSIAMYLYKDYYGDILPFKRIGEYFGNRDHSTVMHAIESVQDQIDSNKVFKQHIHDLYEEVFFEKMSR